MYDMFWERRQGYTHVLQAVQWSAEVEIFNVNSHVFGFEGSNDAVR